jgi:hypothetical protein
MAPKAALKIVESRRDVAERLINLHVKHAALFTEIEGLKEKLRIAAEADGKGFKEEFGEGRHVNVSKPSKSKFKGIVPVLDADQFLALDEKERERLIKGKVISMESQHTQARRPSVSVEY